mgnify:CR=1 FL=1
MQSISRGDVCYIFNTNATGSEQQGDRPNIVVSNDKANRYSFMLRIVFIDKARHRIIDSAPGLGSMIWVNRKKLVTWQERYDIIKK